MRPVGAVRRVLGEAGQARMNTDGRKHEEGVMQRGTSAHRPPSSSEIGPAAALLTGPRPAARFPIPPNPVPPPSA